VGETEREFTCFVADIQANESFSARATFVKKTPIRRNKYDPGKIIALADIYLQDVSGILDRWVTITRDIHHQINITGTSTDVHGHFILFNMNGDGKYIRRDRLGKDLEKRFCSTWSLGYAFGRQVEALLRELM
jgi:hypothetical protein